MIGKLHKNPAGRWEIREGEESTELSCGIVIELAIAGTWIRTCIEYGRIYRDSQPNYYSTTKGTELVEGLKARTYEAM